MRILIVEDDADARANMRDILEIDAHGVMLAATGREAQAIVKRESIDVVILDRKLPDTTAETLLPQIRIVAPKTDVIVVTGYADLDGTIAALRGGAADYILKPVNPDALRTSLNRIAEQRRIAQELYQEHELVDQIFRTAEAILLILGPDGQVQKFNPYLCKVTGWEPAELLGRDWFELFIETREQDAVREYFKQTVAGRESRGVVNGILTKQGRSIQIRWSNTTLCEENGRVLAVLAVGLDVTEVVEAQERVLQSERLAAIGQTMTALAHESRNSLQRIQASTEILELELGDQPQALLDIRSIQRASKDLHGLLEELRSFAAPINLHLKDCDLRTVWQQAWQSLKSQRGWPECVFIESVEVAQTYCLVDEQRIEQVFRNLFENSLSACQPRAEIIVRLRRVSDEALEMSVQDNGPGLTTEQSKRIFEAFYTTKPTGTGLGMAIVQRIVEAHTGHIYVDSSLASGTRIVINLPDRTSRRRAT